MDPCIVMWRVDLKRGLEAGTHLGGCSSRLDFIPEIRVMVIGMEGTRKI